ncbi:hypothetical protein GN244_ATG20338 [Phytophthora infestans]|uniref:Uncharacterized protein n=1 Tax=Phytophthora infestans TaxID=4787 RepID=A0A833VTL4_PHYIN|nr:hypothetical protein GN244_ATG20338 [Phytophthora infestans]KAF4138971.1 hypothetical protein GN958_ATG11928 [Phytophthora infestans]
MVAMASSEKVARLDTSASGEDAQIHHHLRGHTWSATSGDGDRSGERTIDAKLPAMASISNRDSSQTMKNLATSIQQRLTSISEKTIDASFALLKVGAVKSKLFESASFQAWAQAATKSYQHNPQLGQEAMFVTLARHYGDDALAKLLVEAQQGSKTEDIAKQFEAMLFSKWATQKKTAEDVYDLLKLNQKGQWLFWNPLLPTWISFVTKAGKEDPYEFLVLELAKRFNKEELANQFLMAGAYPALSTTVKELKNAEFRINLKAIDDDFGRLGLNIDEGYAIMKNPALSAWYSNVKTHGQSPDELLFSKLRAQFGDETLAKMLAKARSDRALNKAGDKLIEEPMFHYWVSYVMKRETVDPHMSMLLVMKKHYSDETVEKMIANALQRSAFKAC